MFVVDSTEGAVLATEHAAARGELPEWACASPQRRAHMDRVATLLEAWARQLNLTDGEVARWAAAGRLHDVLRDADPADLIPQVAPSERDLPAKILHGPAAAARLEGLVHPSVITAIRYHTIGHPALDELGKALYLADFLEPGRGFVGDWGRGLRQRMPADRDEVLVEVLMARLRRLIDGRKPLRPETAAFWSATVEKVDP